MDPETIKTEQEMTDYLRARSAQNSAARAEDPFTIRHINSLLNKIAKSPELVSDRVLHALTAMAMSSPYADIADGVYDRPQTAAQDECFYATRMLGHIARRYPSYSYKAVAELEHIMESSLDWDVRRQALMTIWAVGHMQGPYRAHTVAALARQAKGNSDAYIRMQSTRQILGIAREHDEALEPALKTMEDRAQNDADAGVRACALGLLDNAVQSVSGMSREMLNHLKDVFSLAANRAGEEAAIVEMAARGLQTTRQRLATPGRPAP